MLLLITSFADSVHVSQLNLDRASDQEVWEYARAHGFTIVSKDSDFHQRSFLYGPPPKVIWIRSGTCSTSYIEDILRRRSAEISAFESDDEGAFMILD